MAEQTAAGRNHLEQKRIELWKSTAFRWLIFLQLLALFVCAYLNIAWEMLPQVNIKDAQVFGGDQMHNMRLATETRPDLHHDSNKGFVQPLKNWLPHRTDGVVNPLWPWMMAWSVKSSHKITEDDMVAKRIRPEDVELFERGRWANVFLTTGFLIMLGIGAARIFSVPAACNMILLAGFGAFLPRAAYFQPEPVYYMFFFLTWVACVSALYHNTLWIYSVIGVLSGIAYLAKGSIQPLLGVFILVSTLRCVWEFFSARRRGYMLGHTHLWHWRNHLVGVVFLGAAHLVTISPRLSEAQERFGDMFHSYPSYWMWMDNFPQGYQWMAEHHTKEQLTSLPKETRPSLGNYLKTHTKQEMLDRLWNGTTSRVGEFFWPKQTKRDKSLDKQRPWRGILEWRGIYLAWLGLILVGLLIVLRAAVPKPEHAGQIVFRHGSIVTILFVAGSFAAYSLAYGFYAPIAHGSGDRFMLSMYLPLVFSLIWGAETIVRRLRRRKSDPWIMRGYLAAQWILFAAISWRLTEILRSPHFYNG